MKECDKHELLITMIKKIISTGYCVNDVTYQVEITFVLDINVFYNLKWNTTRFFRSDLWYFEIFIKQSVNFHVLSLKNFYSKKKYFYEIFSCSAKCVSRVKILQHNLLIELTVNRRLLFLSKIKLHFLGFYA